ncbi:ABC transporter ATP-binding protein [Granulosicoccus sp.]|nr:ABC transporter ATP-binding protein [Granulosicoccus sp.]MDB4223782.1 ABC transporter ATP-binding protein [Granulosicoccus sp.]
MSNIVKLTEVNKSYALANTEVSVLKNLNLAVRNKERVAIIGPSGSGKTTLLLILTGLETQSEGQISIAGKSLQGMSGGDRADLRREHIGIVFQSFHLIPSLTARENVALPLEISGRGNSRQRAMDMLDKVGLVERYDHYPAQLSGGEQQRVAIARALVNEPELIVADEPTGNLDERTGELIMQLLFDLNRDAGTTLLLVTHDTDLANRCDRTLKLQDGSLHSMSPQTSAAS